MWGILIMILIDAFVIVICLPVSVLELTIGFAFKDDIFLVFLILTLGKMLGLFISYILATKILKKCLRKKLEESKIVKGL